MPKNDQSPTNEKPKGQDETDIESPFWEPREAAAYLRCSPRSLERFRALGTGPRWVKPFGKVLYPVEEVKRFAESLRRRRSTSDQAEEQATARDPDPETER